MTEVTETVATAPVARTIARIRDVYRSWKRDTQLAQMRADWDAAFEVCTVPVSCQRVSAGGVDAEWIAPTKASQDKAILYFHGGGFRLGSIASHRDLISRIADASGCRVLAVNYRLAPEHRFPAPVEDALAAYHWMLDQGFESKNIAFAGDSAGGNLVLVAMLSLRDSGQPLPVAAALMSPWTDMVASGESYVSRADADPIHQRAMILALAKNYLGPDVDPCDPLASPLYAELKGLPPLLIQVGGRETVLSDSTMLADKAKAAGVDVELEVWHDMIHVFQMFAAELAEGRHAIGKIARFLDQHLNAERKPL